MYNNSTIREMRVDKVQLPYLIKAEMSCKVSSGLNLKCIVGGYITRPSGKFVKTDSGEEVSNEAYN